MAANNRPRRELSLNFGSSATNPPLEPPATSESTSENASENTSENKSTSLTATGKPKMSDIQTYRGYYIDNELLDIIDQLTADNPRKGAKSDLVNKILRERFRAEGLL